MQQSRLMYPCEGNLLLPTLEGLETVVNTNRLTLETILRENGKIQPPSQYSRAKALLAELNHGGLNAGKHAARVFLRSWINLYDAMQEFRRLEADSKEFGWNGVRCIKAVKTYQEWIDLKHVYYPE